MPGFRKSLAKQCSDFGHDWIIGYDGKGPTGLLVCRRCHVQRAQAFVCGCGAEFLSRKALGDHQRSLGHHGREVVPTVVGMDKEDCEEIEAETVADLAALLKELE